MLTGGGGRRREISLYLGEATNNVAESCALIVALQEALKAGSRRVSVFTDSELLARQVTGLYKVKDRQLQWLHALIQQLVRGFEEFQIGHVPRGANRAADQLANRAVNEWVRREGGSRKKARRIAAPQSLQPTLF